MGVVWKSINFYNEFRNESVDFLLANIGDKIRIEHEIEFSNYAIASSGNEIIMNYTDGVIPGPVGSIWVYDPQGQFVNFKIGDELERKDYTTNIVSETGYIIIDKLGDNLILLDSNPGAIGADSSTADSILNVLTPPTACKYKWNFIENDEGTNYLSKVDGSEQILLATGLDFLNPESIVQMQFLGPKPYQIGSAECYHDGINTNGVYAFRLILVHYTYITPFFLSAQWDDLLAKIAPSYLFDSESFKAIFEVTMYYNYNDPNRVITGDLITPDGNTGWFDENFNSGVTNYSVDSITYEESGNPIPGILFSTTETDVEITIKNTTDSPFSNNNTKFTLNFCKAPQDEDEYQGNAKTLDQNFIFDRAHNTVGAANVNGDNYGGNYQVLKGVGATFVSADEIVIHAKIAMDTSILTGLSTLDEKRYIIWVAIQNHTEETIDADKVALLADAQEFYENATDPGMIVFAGKYLRHFESNPLTEGDSSCNAYKEDEVTAFTQFYVDHNGRTVDQFGNDITIKLTSIEAKIKMLNTVTLEEFDLDTTGEISLSNLPYINGDQYIDYTLQRAFHIPSGEIRKEIKVKRTPVFDGADTAYYYVQFPFLVRWEYFIKLLISSGDFFDTGEPFNGFNNDWFRMQEFADWAVVYEVIISSTKSTVLTTDFLTFRHADTITLEDYDNKFADFQARHIKSFGYNTATLDYDIPLYDVVNQIDYILGYDYTLIKATFERTGAIPINLPDVAMCIGIEVFEEGGVDGRRRYSSEWISDGDTWFLSTDNSDKVELVLNEVAPVLGVGNETVTGKLLIDFTKIPLNKSTFKITARLYDKASALPLAKLTEVGDIKLTEDGNIKIMDA